MSCSCVLTSYDCDDAYEPMTELVFRATHKRQCIECQFPINRGDYYEYFVGERPARDHGYETFACATCMDCVSVRNEFFCNGWCYGMVWEDLAEHLDDIEGEVSSECLASLTPAAKGGVLNIIDDVFDDMDREETGI